MQQMCLGSMLRDPLFRVTWRLCARSHTLDNDNDRHALIYAVSIMDRNLESWVVLGTIGPSFRVGRVGTAGIDWLAYGSNPQPGLIECTFWLGIQTDGYKKASMEQN